MRRVLTGFHGLNGGARTLVIEDGLVVERTAGRADAPDAESLDGKWLLPAFVDAHCHILPTGLDLRKLHLGSCATWEAVLDSVRKRLPEVEPGDWLLAVHYDQTKFPDARHLTRAELDAISAEVPILLRHVNGHASVANSAALVRAGVDESTPDPKGGEFVRDESGRLTGVLLETAHEHVSHAKPNPTVEQMVEAILEAARSMRGYGITCASDMMTGAFDLDDELTAYRLASERGCPIRLRLYLQWSTVFGPRAMPAERLREHLAAMDPARCRTAGIKIFADGAIGSATAAIYGTFETNGGNGQLIYAPDRLHSMVRTAHDAGWPVSIHSIGDRSTDLVMDAYEAVGDAGRHRIEHAMILSDAQIERMARLGIRCAMQPEFLHALGHAYKRQLGPERAARLKRTRSVLDAGIRLSFNSDRPIVTGNPWIGIRTAAFRPEGFDPLESVTLGEAFDASTRGGAEANGDGDSMGSLERGRFADFQVYGASPLEADGDLRPERSELAGETLGPSTGTAEQEPVGKRSNS